MVEWSMALPLTVCFLSSLPSLKPGQSCEKVVTNLELGSGFLLVLQFLTPLTTGQSLFSLHNREVTVKEIQCSATASRSATPLVKLTLQFNHTPCSFLLTQPTIIIEQHCPHLQGPSGAVSCHTHPSPGIALA